MKRWNIDTAIEDIPLSREEFNRIMGFKAGVPAPFDQIFAKVSNALRIGTAAAEVAYFHNSEVEILQDRIILQEVVFYTGHKVTSCLQSCKSAALFICTLGAAFEERMKSFDSDPLEAYFANTLGSLLCEAWANKVHESILIKGQEEGLLTTNRYSPGYCHWSVEEQQKLFLFFKDSPTGIRLNNSSLMLPIKSISGVVGMGKRAKRIPYTCSVCADMRCIYRK